MIGRSRQMVEVFRQIRLASATDIPVLISGETGTGKDVVAQAIHNQSDRSGAPFVPIHLGALPGELVAGELFGHEKGAFTGAMQQRPGTFEQADGGTIFLDEIGTIDERVQVSLLRLIEQKTFTRLGGADEQTVDVRLIAATNQELHEEVERGGFREDLYFRLNVFHLVIPPLRARHGDIPLLIEHFLEHYNHEYGKRIHGVAPDCFGLLEEYDWPGNVRELKNVVQRAVLVCSGEVLLPEHLPPRFRPERVARARVSFEVGTALKDVEREMIVQTLASVGNNKKRTAEILGISRRALYNKLKRYAIG